MSEQRRRINLPREISQEVPEEMLWMVAHRKWKFKRTSQRNLMPVLSWSACTALTSRRAT